MTIIEVLKKLRDDLKLWVANNLNTKVDKVYGKDLSTNDFTNEYKTKLDSIETFGLVKSVNNITPDENGNIEFNNIPEINDATTSTIDTWSSSKISEEISKAAISGDVDLTDYYTKEEIGTLTEQALSNYYDKEEIADLTDIALSGYYTKTETDTAISEAISGIKTGGSSVQPDWNQSDETAPDYIKNRPFYEEEKVDVLPKQDLTFALDSGGEGYLWFDTSGVYELEFNTTYIVVWDGIKYECSSYGEEDIDQGWKHIHIGNSTIDSAVESDEQIDTDMPFVVRDSTLANGAARAFTIGTFDTNTSHNVHIYKKPEIHQIDSKYIKDMYGETVEIVEIFNEDITIPEELEVIVEGQLQIPFEIGQSYVITYANKAYECIVQSYAGIPVLGNLSILGMPDTGEPFAILYDHTGDAIGTSGMSIIFSEVPDENPTNMKIVGHIKTITQIDHKYIKDMYSSEMGEIDLLAKNDYTFAEYQGGTYTYQTTTIPFTPNLGEIYLIQWDGTLYECVGTNFEAMGCVTLGNQYIGLSDYQNTEEPFMVGVLGGVFGIMTQSAETSHNVRIYQKSEVIHQINPKYLPILEATGAKVLIPEQTSVLAGQDESYLYFLSKVDYSTFLTLNGQIVYVNYNGTIYELSVMVQGDNVIIGNEISTDGTGAPFNILFVENMCFLCNKTGEPHVNVKVATQLKEYVIKDEYLPDTIGSGGSANVDLSDYYSKEEIDAMFQTYVAGSVSASEVEEINALLGGE